MLQTYLKAKYPFTPPLQALGRDKGLATVANRSQFKPQLSFTSGVMSGKLPNLSEPLISSSVKWDNYMYLKEVVCKVPGSQWAPSKYQVIAYGAVRDCWEHPCVVGKGHGAML